MKAMDNNELRAHATVILAAGAGTRMKSDLPKVLHLMNGRPLLDYVLDVALSLKPERCLVVVGHQWERVIEECGRPELEFVIQEKRLGTGHAVCKAEPKLKNYDGPVLILNGDVPLIPASLIEAMLQFHLDEGNVVTVLSGRFPTETHYGRIIRDGKGTPTRITEYRDATPDERKIDEMNAGTYVLQAPAMFELLLSINRDNNQNEYYLTDIFGAAIRSGLRAGVFRAAESKNLAGINTIRDLSALEREMN